LEEWWGPYLTKTVCFGRELLGGEDIFEGSVVAFEGSICRMAKWKTGVF